MPQMMTMEQTLLYILNNIFNILHYKLLHTISMPTNKKKTIHINKINWKW